MPPIGLLLGKVDFSNLFMVIREGKIAGAHDSWLLQKQPARSLLTMGSLSIP